MGRADEAETVDAAGPAEEAPPGGRPGAPSGAWPAAWPWLLLPAFVLLDLAVYRDALGGPFVSDDVGYIVASPYTRDLSLASALALFDPTNAAHLYTANYAPVHLLLTGLERNIFASDVFGFHLINVIFHALNSVLLIALLRRSRIPTALALFGGVVFAVHPANVEAVAWISQLKTCAALAFSLGALLALERRPAAATVLFVLALLTKASALFALPTAMAFLWARGAAAGAGPGPEPGSRWRWLALWAVLAAAYAVPQFGFFGATGGAEVAGYADPFVHARSIGDYAARYLVMAVSGIGVAAFQEPPPADSILDPWWLASLPLGAAILWRMGVAFRSRTDEFAYWVAAAASFVPISQILPFLIPVADRYLYFILPGLIGAAACIAVPVGRHFAPGPWPRRLAIAGGAAVVGLFAVASAQRAKLWTNETFLLLDAARAYPDGGTAAFLTARRAAQAGDVAAAVAALRLAADRGLDRFSVIGDDPGLAPIRAAPEFQAFLRELAALSIERVERRDDPTAPELRQAAHAHLLRAEYAEAVAMLELALARGGPFEPVVREELAAVRAGMASGALPGNADAPSGGAGHRSPQP